MTATHFSGPVKSVNGFYEGTGSVVSITAATTLTREAHDGKSLVLNAAAGKAITLPAVATSAGIKFKFIIGTVFGTPNWTVTSAEGDNIEGAIMVASTVVDGNAADAVNFAFGAENLGDWASLDCDGTYWYVDGKALSTGGITLTG